MCDDLIDLGKKMQENNKKASDVYKQHSKIDRLAEKQLFELCYKLCEKYDLKLGVRNEMGFKDNKYAYFIENNFTHFNYDFEGEYRICLLGNLSEEQVNEICKITGCQHFKIIPDDTGFYSVYVFEFNFYEEYNVGYQMD